MVEPRSLDDTRRLVQQIADMKDGDAASYEAALRLEYSNFYAHVETFEQYLIGLSHVQYRNEKWIDAKIINKLHMRLTTLEDWILAGDAMDKDSRNGST